MLHDNADEALRRRCTLCFHRLRAAQLLSCSARLRCISLSVGMALEGTAQVGTAQVGTSQVGTAQVGTAQVGTAYLPLLVVALRLAAVALTRCACFFQNADAPSLQETANKNTAL